jgi:phenylpropionate dioxygenase-like ring-hydroxylating dioxygenase large terminal subunit
MTAPPGAAPALDPDAAQSLPGWVYHDPEFFAAEQALLLRQAWQVVCHTSDIPGQGDW